jgi:hypothetical protein
MEERGGWATTITPELAAFIAERNSFFLATASASGQPYIQHRGGPPGFLRVVDESTLEFTELIGNKQYITHGNLAENDQAMLFLIDYVAQRRVKIFVRASVTPNETISMRVAAWDENCPQHIPQLISAEKVEGYLASLHARIAELEAQLRKSAP